MKKFAKFKDKLTKWKQRDLSLKGKKMIINSYIMSTTSYLCETYTNHIPQKYVTKTKELIRDFLWSGKTWRISQKTLALRKVHGAVELQDIDNFIMCKKIKWILRIICTPQMKWNSYGKYCLALADNTFHTQNFIMQCSNMKGSNIVLPDFYQTCIEAWQSNMRKKNITCKNDILEQNLFGNHAISKQNKSLFFANWIESNFCKIRDIWDQVSNNWKSGEKIYNQLANKRNWMAEYNKIKNCIQGKWKNILRNENLPLETNQVTYYRTQVKLFFQKVG